jgi:hypothetical protein
MTSGKSGEGLLELGDDDVAFRQPLGDDKLRQEGIVELHVERQVEPDGAAADVGRVPHDVRIAVDQLLRAVDFVARGVDRGVLGQHHRDQDLRAVGGREELLLHELGGVEGEREGSERHGDRHVFPEHEGQEHSIGDACPDAGPPNSRSAWGLRVAGRTATPMTGAKSTATNQETTSASATTANSE